MKLYFVFFFLTSFAFGQNLKSASVYFEVNQSQSPQLNANNTEAFFDKIAKNSKIIRIEAFCDSTGGDSYNLKLARKRLQSVADFMKLLPYNMETTELIAHGESSPKNTSASLAEERRVEIYFIEPAIKVIAPPVRIEELPQPEPVVEKIAPKEKLISSGEFSKKAIETFIAEESTELQLDMNILFVNASDRVLRESESQLKDLLQTMEKHPELKAKFHGHVCCAYNLDLSEARARTVYMYLVQNEIDPSRLSYEGHSNSVPKVSPELTEEDRKQNRRVTVVFTK